MKRTEFCAMLSICLVMLAGCKHKMTAPGPDITVPFEHAQAIDLEQFIESVRYVTLENHPESAFTDIDKLIVSGGNIFMLDKRLEAVFCFDTTGRFRYRIQRVGRGPGEYHELDAFWVKPVEKELWLQSFWPPKIYVYNFDGQMLREIKIRWPGKDMVRLDGGLLAGYNPTRSDDGVDSLRSGIFLLREDGNYKSQPKVIGDSTIYWSLSYQRNLEEFGNGALILSQSDTIYKINQKGEVSPDVHLDWGKYKYPEELRDINYDTPRTGQALKGNYVHGKDQLIAFGPIRLFRIFVDTHMEMAIADLNSGKGVFSTQVTCRVAGIPLLYPIAKSDQGDLIGVYDMPLLLAMKESQADRKADSKNQKIFRVMDSLAESAFKQDRPVLWFARIKQEWLTKSY
jgi:hypothetical protein